MRKLFIAGSTGVTGRALTGLADQRGVSIIPHVRPRPRGAPTDPRAAVLDLSDEPALAAALGDATTVVQLIGTTRKRFASGDTYETSDIATTRQLAAAAGRAGTIDHFVLLSSTGAGRPVGAYLRAKATAELVVRQSGLPFTIFRPSAFVGEGRRPPPGAATLARLLGLRKLQPIGVDELAAAILLVAGERSHLGEVLEGDSLWAVVGAA
jgi:uncharacterized protein YbjT (DUF2867 family)